MTHLLISTRHLRSLSLLVALSCLGLACSGESDDGSSSGEGDEPTRGGTGGTLNGPAPGEDGSDVCPEDPPPRLLVTIPQAEVDGTCPVSAVATLAGASTQLTCDLKQSSGFCACPFQPAEGGEVTVDVVHDDGRTGMGSVTIENPEPCFSTELSIDIGERPAPSGSGGGPFVDDCNLPCQDSSECPLTSLGQFCITGCCAEEN